MGFLSVTEKNDVLRTFLTPLVLLDFEISAMTWEKQYSGYDQVQN